MGGFKPHAHPDLYDTPEKRKELKKLLADYNLEVADYAADTWSADSIKNNKQWMALYDNSIKFMADMGWKIIRIDSGARRYCRKTCRMSRQGFHQGNVYNLCASRGGLRHSGGLGV